MVILSPKDSYLFTKKVFTALPWGRVVGKRLPWQGAPTLPPPTSCISCPLNVKYNPHATKGHFEPKVPF